MSASQKAPGGTGQTGGWILIGLAAVAAVAAGVLQLGHRVDAGDWYRDKERGVVWHPLTLLAGLAKGQYQWSGWATGIGAALGVLLLVLVVLVIRWLRRRKAGKRGWNGKAADLGDGARMHLSNVTKAAVKGRLTVSDTKGVEVARSLNGNKALFMGWRDTMFAELGPGAGKSGGLAIPMVHDAPGNVLFTSNRRDVADATRLTCERRGWFWCFDPELICDYPEQNWYWNPLTYLDDGEGRSPERAKDLAKILCDAGEPPGAQKSSYWDSAGPNLIAHHLLAAFAAGRPITAVYSWLHDDKDDEPVGILKAAGYPLQAAALRKTYDLHEKQRQGVFGIGQEAMAFLGYPSLHRWMVRQAGAQEFVPAEFVKPFRGDAASRDTLAVISKESRSAAQLTTALTVAVSQAAEKESTRWPHGRLPIPLVFVGDEIANVCRWKELPAQFSHYGGRGICPIAIFQNWAQGKEMWGQDGMDKLWGASTVRIVGSGLADARHLSDISKLLGSHWEDTYSTASGGGKGGGRSVTYSQAHMPIFDVSDLVRLEPGFALIIPSGGDPVMVRTVNWFDRDAKGRPARPDMYSVLQASVEKYEPAGSMPVLPGAVDAT